MKLEGETYAIESVTAHGKNSSDAQPQQPDSDSIKLFVGQIPRSMTEEQLHELFAVYGRIYQIGILKDQGTMENKGCAFLTFYTRKSALDAQNTLHGNKILPGMKYPMQVKPANSELKNEEERRLFIGMLPKTMSDNELTIMFAPYGALEDCVILKDRDGLSKGCAFVTYASKKSAQLAIKTLHHSTTLEGCRMPLVVKAADTQKDKELKIKQKKMLESGQNSSPYMSLLQQAVGGSHLASLKSNLGSRFQAGAGPAMTQYPLPNAAQGMNNSPAGIQEIASALNVIASNPVLNTILNPNMTLLQQLTSLNSAGANSSGQGMLQSGHSNVAQQNQGMYGAQGNVPFRSTSRPFFNVKGHYEGPENCNLFIYHIPEEFGDSDITQIFAPFGNIVSSRVFVDRKTNVSKGFGFVSYDNPVAARNAIQAMNGFQIGNRRLKVELKKPKAESKPY